MPIMFNTLLFEVGIKSLAEVRLLRHQDDAAMKGRSPYELWRDDRPAFEAYQSVQSFRNRPRLARAQYWASFVGVGDQTLFAGLYQVRYRGVLDHDIPKPHVDGFDKAGTADVYDLALGDALKDLSGKLWIEWGPSARAWIQRADNQNKQVVEIRREFKEPDFPGFLEFMTTLSELTKLPRTWVEVLRSAKGVYLLTCPKTKEQYVGSATGEGGLLQRWLDYAVTGHGGNVALKSRDPADYQVSILEIAGSAMTTENILAMEERWKQKLQSREMGLNRN